ncbi:MAG: carbon-monoxide dehydrogenase large subunit [Chloroflexi bacterium]|nr:MAG: carbon-monoxide dehydrogenase large subunit [Chloroflexota bacterium]
MATYTGQSLRRTEDERLLLGNGNFTDDIVLPGTLHAAFLRSDRAHARIVSIDASAGLAIPGVVAVMTAADLGDVPNKTMIVKRDGMQEDKMIPHPILATDRVRYVGEPIAIVVAEERYLAFDALEYIVVEYDPLPAVVDPRQAMKDEVILHEDIGTNVVMKVLEGEGDIEEAFGKADHVVGHRYDDPRISAFPMEPRATLASYSPEEKRLTVWTSSQVPHQIKRYLAPMLGLEPDQVRAIAPDVGGGFGRKIELWSDEVALSVLSMKLGRPVKWTEDRRENLLSTHGRAFTSDVEAAINNDGTILGMRFRMIADLGAYFYTSTGGPLSNAAHRVAGPYGIPVMDIEVLGVFTNGPPTGPYRGAGGPEAALLTERIIDVAAGVIGMDPAEVRRRNFISADAFPYKTATGYTYDSGDYQRAFDRALELSEHDGWREAQRKRGPNEPLLGIGVAAAVKASGGSARTRNARADVYVEPSGAVKITTEASPHGQGTETTFAQIAADALGVPYESITILHSDSDMLESGHGTTSSRGLAVAGSAMYEALIQTRAKAAAIAGHILGCAADDVVFEDGKVYSASDPEQAMAFSELASAAYRPEKLPEGLEAGLDTKVSFTLDSNPFGFGAHVAVVEVDRDTGDVKLIRYTAVHDCGILINPMVVEGQIHGGLVQGISQALYEAMYYSPDGQPLTASLMNYAVPIAEELPTLVTDSLETPSPTNAMGIKGVGELPTVGSPPAVANAIMDALAGMGVDNLDTPITPERVWRAMQAAR